MSVRKTVLSAVTVLILALLFGIKQAVDTPTVEPGRMAPKFSFITDEGFVIARDDFGGKLLVLNFWATWCSPCIEEMPTLNRFASETHNDGIIVAAVSVDRNEQVYRRFLQALKPVFSTFRDPASDIPYWFGTYKIPETYVIDRRGRVRRKYISYQDWLEPSIANDIRGLLSE